MKKEPNCELCGEKILNKNKSAIFCKLCADDRNKNKRRDFCKEWHKKRKLMKK